MNTDNQTVTFSYIVDSNYNKALAKLEEVVVNRTLNDLSALEREGLIQRFEYTYELAWNTIKDFYQHQGEEEL